MELDLSADAAALTAALVDTPSVSGDEEQLAGAIEAALTALPHLSVERFGNSIVARTSLGRAERVVLAGHIDTVPLAGNLPAARRRRPALRLRDQRHEVGGRGAATPGGRPAGAGPRRDLRVLRLRGDRGREERSRAPQPEPPRPAGRGFRGAHGAQRVRDRGWLPGDDAGRGHRDRAARAQRPVLDGAQRDPRGRRHPRRAAPVRAPGARGRWPAVSRGAEQRRHQRRRGRERDPGPVRGHGQLPVRAGPGHRGRAAAPARCVRPLGRDHRRRRPQRPARAEPRAGGLVRRRGGRGAASQAGLDRRGPVRRAGHPGGQLRARYLRAGPHQGRVRGAGQHRRLRDPHARAGWPAPDDRYPAGPPVTWPDRRPASPKRSARYRRCSGR